MSRPPGKLISSLILLPFVIMLIGYLMFRETGSKRPDELTLTTAGFVEMCLSCHNDKSPTHAQAKAWNFEERLKEG